MKSIARKVAMAVLIALTVPIYAHAQTALTSTTLAAAATATATTVSVASATGISAGGRLFVDREFMAVVSVSGTTITVRRGIGGTVAAAHPNASLVYAGAPARFYTSVPKSSTCVRTAELYLPRVIPLTGEVWDCPVGTVSYWTLINGPNLKTARSVWFNLDNGAGTTIDDVLIHSKRPIYIAACRIVYVDATTGTVAGGNAKVGTTVGGAEVVAATAYENSAAVGATTAMTVLAALVPANTSVFVRHTGVAITQAGQSVVECDYIDR